MTQTSRGSCCAHPAREARRAAAESLHPSLLHTVNMGSRTATVTGMRIHQGAASGISSNSALTKVLLQGIHELLAFESQNVLGTWDCKIFAKPCKWKAPEC